jgi:hypothetical protein
MRPDTKQRGGVRPEPDGSIVYNCFNCGFKTGWRPGEFLSKNMCYLLGRLGVPSDTIDKLKFQIARDRETMKREELIQSVRLPEFKSVPLPEGAKPISYWAGLAHPPKEFIAAMEYLFGRGEHIFNGWTYYWSPKYKSVTCETPVSFLNHRLIVPYYWRGDIVGWTTRLVKADGKGRKYIKYVQPDFLFNNDVLLRRDRRFVIVVEGELDAIAIDGVASLGKKLSKAQAHWLKQSGKEVILVGDREHADVNLVDFALEYKFSASFPVWDYGVKDVADAVRKYGRIYTLKTILDAATADRFAIMMGKKQAVRTR